MVHFCSLDEAWGSSTSRPRKPRQHSQNRVKHPNMVTSKSTKKQPVGEAAGGQTGWLNRQPVLQVTCQYSEIFMMFIVGIIVCLLLDIDLLSVLY